MISGNDKAAKYAWKVLSDTLLYSAKRIPEIADDVVDVDNAMKWGFGWEMGPFETWDALGVKYYRLRHGRRGSKTVAPESRAFLAAGQHHLLPL